MDEAMPQWVQSAPTKPGWYWAWRKSYTCPVMIMVFFDGVNGRYARHELPNASRSLKTEEFSHWYGPVPAPPPKPE